MRGQREVADKIIAAAQEDGHFDGCDDGPLGALDLLDYMGIEGVQFAEGTAASDEYLRSAAPGSPRADLRLTAGELRQWLMGVPDGAVVRLNVSGAVGDCEGHVLGAQPDDASQRVVVLTSGGAA